MFSNNLVAVAIILAIVMDLLLSKKETEFLRMKVSCKLLFSKIQHLRALLIQSEFIKMNGVISKFYPPHINLVFRVYYLSAQNEESFKAKRILWFTMLLFFNCFELVKSLINGIVDSNLLRYYLFDFICTLQSNQIIFDFSFAITYVYIIRLSLRLLLGRANGMVFNAKYLKFLEADTEQALIEKHSFTTKDARDYFKLIKLIVKFIKYNDVAYLVGGNLLPSPGCPFTVDDRY